MSEKSIRLTAVNSVQPPARNNPSVAANESAARVCLQVATGTRSDNLQDAETYASDREGLALRQAPAAKEPHRCQPL